MSDELGRPAYLKPRRPMVPEAAALEKLASDLAHDLGVRVPPVVLTNPPTAWSGATEICASLVLYGFQLHWGAASHGTKNKAEAIPDEQAMEHARGAIQARTRWGELILEAAVAAAAPALVFDTWVGQPDHDHPSNIAWGMNLANEADHGLCFFDYEMAFGVGGWAPVAPAPFPRELLAVLKAEDVMRAVTAVESLGAEHISAVVNRIPERFMSAERKRNIVTQLMDRRRRLHAALEPVAKRLV